MLREHSFSEDNLAYLGVREDSIGIPQHWYSIGGTEVPVDAIEELNSTEEEWSIICMTIKKGIKDDLILSMNLESFYVTGNMISVVMQICHAHLII